MPKILPMTILYLLASLLAPAASAQLEQEEVRVYSLTRIDRVAPSS